MWKPKRFNWSKNRLTHIVNIILQLFWHFHYWPLNHEVKLNSKKKLVLINRLLWLQLSEVFRTLTQASRSLLLLKGWEIKEREPYHLLGVHTKLDLNRFHWSLSLWFQKFTLNKETLDVSPGNESVANLNKKFSALCFLQDPSRQPSSSVFVGKVSAKLLWEKTTISL